MVSMTGSILRAIRCAGGIGPDLLAADVVDILRSDKSRLKCKMIERSRIASGNSIAQFV